MQRTGKHHHIIVYLLLTLLVANHCPVLTLNATEPVNSRMVPGAGYPGTAYRLPHMIPTRLFPMKSSMPMDPLLYAAPQIMTNAIVPMAVSFSLGYFLFKLLAMGVFLLEKELAFPFGHLKMDSAQFQRQIAPQWSILPLLKRVQQAIEEQDKRN